MDAEKNASTRPLLKDTDNGQSFSITDGEATTPQHHQLKALLRKQRHIRIGLLLAYLPALCICILGYIQWRRYSFAQIQRPFVHPELIPSPLHEANAIEWNVQRFPPNFRSSVFAGEPSAELDLAWHELFEDNDVRVSKKDLDRLGVQSVELVDGGYVAQPAVFHELHCLKKIRHWIFKENYVLNQNLSHEELEEWPPHINHCIEMLRVAIICRGDVSLSTYGWIGAPEQRRPSAWDNSPHQCVNWDKLRAWTRANSVNISAPGTIYDENGNVYN